MRVRPTHVVDYGRLSALKPASVQISDMLDLPSCASLLISCSSALTGPLITSPSSACAIVPSCSLGQNVSLIACMVGGDELQKVRAC